MAAPSVAFDGTRVSGAESETDGGTWEKWGSTQSPTQETDFVLQGTYSISNKASGGQDGVQFTDDATVDYTTPKVVIAKINVTTYSIMDSRQGATNNPGLIYQVGSGDFETDVYDYYVAGYDYYPIVGGFIILVIDPNQVAWRDAVTGSPSLSAVDFYGMVSEILQTSKSDNIVHDALDYVNAGKGLTLLNGESANPGTFQDFIDDDEGDATNGRYGIVFTSATALLVRGTLTIGSSGTLAYFRDANRSVFFPRAFMLCGPGHLGLAFDLQNASTDIAIANSVFQGNGQGNTKVFFDSDHQVESANDTIAMPEGTFAMGGDEEVPYVLYSREGGSQNIGLTDATGYWLNLFATAAGIDYWTAHTSRQAAITATGAVALTPSTSGNGENHSLRLQPDIRPDINVTGTSGVGQITGSSLLRFRQINLTSVFHLHGCTIIGCFAIDLNGAQLSGSSLSQATLAPGEPLVVTSDLELIYDCAFTASDEGHAIEIDTAGTYDLVDVLLSGYGPAEQPFNAQNDVDNTNDEIDITGHPYTTGDSVFYSDEGGTAISGLTDQAMYYVRSVTANAISLHLTKYGAVNNVDKIAIAPGSDETHKLYSTKAAIYNSSGGLVTINVDGGTLPTIRNSAGSTTVAQQTVVLLIRDAVANSRCAIYDDNKVELMNKEAISVDQVFTEGFENTAGYDETWSGGATVGGSSTVDPNQSTSTVTGAPTKWFDECLRIVKAASENAYIRNVWSPALDPTYLSFEFILDTDTIANQQSAVIAQLYDNLNAYLMILSFYRDISGNLQLRADINHDGAGGSSYYYDIAQDTPYLVECYWDNASNAYALRICQADEINSPTVVASGTLTGAAAGYTFNDFTLGGTSASSYTFTAYFDRVRLSETDYPESLSDLVDVQESYAYEADIGAEVRIRKQSRAPKYFPVDIGGEITADGLTVEAGQDLDTIAAT